jgi:RHS repeat-associated protein
LKHIDSNGNEINYVHNLAQRVETVTDRLGRPTTFSYDNRGNVLQKTDALGATTSYSYDANDNVLTETNTLGKTTTYTYDAQDNRTSVTDALGNRTEFTYNLQGRLLTSKDARGNITTNTYDTAGNPLTTVDASGITTAVNTFSVLTGQLTRTKDALNNETSFEYFGSYLTKVTDPLGQEKTFTYDGNGNRKTESVRRTNSQGQLEVLTTTFDYDNLNRLAKTTYPDGTFTRTEYNSLGQQSATIDQAGNRTEFVYDNQGRQIRTIHPDGKFEESTFDAEGRRLTSKDRSGKVTNFEYDLVGRLKLTIYSDGTFTISNYDPLGQVLNSVDARGNATTFTYDDIGRRMSVKNSLNQITSFGYDGNGNQVAMVDALNQQTTYVYDNLNRRTRTNFADSSFVETTFDQLGRRIAEKDQAGKITQFVYDNLGRLTKVIDALNQETRYGYNELGQQITQTDANNKVTLYQYDQLGRRIGRILPMGQLETYAYNNLGNLTSKTDFNGKTTTYGYDVMRRLISKTPDASLNEPVISFTYNDLGQRATMTDGSGVTNYNYDVRNRLASKQTPFGTLTYTYDENSNLKSTNSSNPNGVSVDYAYDSLNRVSGVRDNRLSGNQETTYSYDAVGNLQSYSYPNQVTTSYAYNNLNRLTTLSVSNGQVNLASYAYTLGALGNRTSVTEGNGRSVNYGYDDLYRLTSETINNAPNSGQITYQYDAVGNRLARNSSVNQVPSMSSTFDNNDRLTSDGYDNNGSTKVSNGKSYNYDFENKLTQTSDGVTIGYDGDGNRISKTVNGVTTFYLVDTNNLTGYAQVVEELQNGVGVVKSYTYGLDLISQRSASGVNFYQYDGHGSVRGLTDANAQITDTYAYDAFGTLIEKTGNTANNYLYAGEQFDADLGFYYNRARYLNVETGRFISMDSYEGSSVDAQSLHKYSYVENNPVSKIDPSGNTSTQELNSVQAGFGTIRNISYAQPLATKAAMPLAAFESTALSATTGTAIVTTVGTGFTLSQSVAATAFAVSLAIAIGAIALRMIKERFEKEGYQFITVFRHASRLNASNFTIGKNDDDGYLSVWDGLPAPLPSPGSSEKLKYNVPFLALFKSPIRDFDRGLLVQPFLPNVQVMSNPLDDFRDPASHLHYSLVFNGVSMPYGNGYQGDIPERLAEHGQSLNLKKGEFRDPYFFLR